MATSQSERREARQLDRIEQQLATIIVMLTSMQKTGAASLQLERQIMEDLAELTATAEHTSGTMDSAIVVINGISARIDAAVAAAPKAPPELKAALKQLSDGLRARADALAFAIDANATGTAPVVPTDAPL